MLVVSAKSVPVVPTIMIRQGIKDVYLVFLPKAATVETVLMI